MAVPPFATRASRCGRSPHAEVRRPRSPGQRRRRALGRARCATTSRCYPTHPNAHSTATTAANLAPRIFCAAGQRPHVSSVAGLDRGRVVAQNNGMELRIQSGLNLVPQVKSYPLLLRRPLGGALSNFTLPCRRPHLETHPRAGPNERETDDPETDDPQRGHTGSRGEMTARHSFDPAAQ